MAVPVSRPPIRRKRAGLVLCRPPGLAALATLARSIQGERHRRQRSPSLYALQIPCQVGALAVLLGSVEWAAAGQWLSCKDFRQNL
jgi:hypothetical protein